MIPERRSTPWSSRASRVALPAMVWACALGIAGQTPAPATPASAPPAHLYSLAQSMRGEAVYRRACASCHGEDLYGNPDAEVPALRDDEFLVPWEGRTVRELLAKIERTMPGNRPGALPAGEYRDVTAFLLRSNGFPAGDADLPADDALARTRLARP